MSRDRLLLSARMAPGPGGVTLGQGCGAESMSQYREPDRHDRGGQEKIFVGQSSVFLEDEDGEDDGGEPTGTEPAGEGSGRGPGE